MIPQRCYILESDWSDGIDKYSSAAGLTVVPAVIQIVIYSLIKIKMGGYLTKKKYIIVFCKEIFIYQLWKESPVPALGEAVTFSFL